NSIPLTNTILVAEIPHVIHLLTQSPPSAQQLTIEKYFTSSAEFTHPFCRTFSFEGSRWAVYKIYQAYKIMSPSIDLEVKSVGQSPIYTLSKQMQRLTLPTPQRSTNRTSDSTSQSHKSSPSS